MLADDIYECRIQGDVCPPTLKCLKQKNGSHVCGCKKKGYVLKGDDQERTCEGISAKFHSNCFLVPACYSYDQFMILTPFYPRNRVNCITG